MSTMALYKALLEAHVSENLAAKAVEDLQPTDVATKSDLDLKTSKSDLKELEFKILKQLDLMASKSDLDLMASKSDLKELELKMASALAQLETRLTWRTLGGTTILLSITIALIKII